MIGPSLLDVEACELIKQDTIRIRAEFDAGRAEREAHWAQLRAENKAKEERRMAEWAQRMEKRRISLERATLRRKILRDFMAQESIQESLRRFKEAR